MKITPNDTLFLGSSKYLDISKKRLIFVVRLGIVPTTTKNYKVS